MKSDNSPTQRELKNAKLNNTRLYTWREYEEETWLYYYRARYYKPELWRFISRDPIWQYDDVNLYTYVWNNPVNYMDPWGLEKEIVDFTKDFYYYINDVLQQSKKEKSSMKDFIDDSFWKYNFKYLPPFYENGKQVDKIFKVEWVEIRWDQIWNFFIWFNWREHGFNFDQIKDWSLLAQQLVELKRWNIVNNYNIAFKNEKEDRIWYDAGYIFNEFAHSDEYVKDYVKVKEKLKWILQSVE